MSTERFFLKEHIDSCHLNASPILAEQAIHCLELVSELADNGLSFQFKGGNSLLMLLKEPKRFSIDVDIATDKPREEIELVLDDIISKNKRFYRWERRQHKTKPWIPLSSYYLFYRSLYQTEQDCSVMLDVQMRRSPYRTEFKPVVCGNIYQSTIKAEIPLPSSIIGDKLLTLGPSTLGIPLGKGKEAQRLKHVYDVSRLLYTFPKLSEIKESFKACINQENSIQQKEILEKDIIADTLNFCWSVVFSNDKPDLESCGAILAENARGIEPFSAHLFESGYSWKNLQIDMARVALCISAAGEKDVSDEQFISALEGKGIRGVLPENVLALNREARKYWETVSQWSDINFLQR